MIKVKEHAKRPSSTKSGPGRYHHDGAQKPGAASRRPGGCGEYSLFLRIWIARKGREANAARRAKQAKRLGQ
jgi:hypothetical protein